MSPPWLILTLLYICHIHTHIWFLLCLGLGLCFHVCVGTVRLLVSCEQPADSDCVKFSRSYLTCQQSEDLADQMCVCASRPRAAWERQYACGAFVCLSACENHANVRSLGLICALINVNIKPSGNAGVNALIAGEGVNVCVS